nr:unnamed protein product [Brassica rapa]
MSCKPEVNDFAGNSRQPTTAMKDVLKMTQTTTTRYPQTAPLTIFYNGEVIVFSDFSAEKAKEVMDLASKGTANTFTGLTSTVNLPKSQTEVRTNLPRTKFLMS